MQKMSPFFQSLWLGAVFLRLENEVLHIVCRKLRLGRGGCDVFVLDEGGHEISDRVFHLFCVSSERHSVSGGFRVSTPLSA